MDRRSLIRAAWAWALPGATWGAQVLDIYRSAGPWRDDQDREFPLERLYGTPAVITMAFGASQRVCSTGMRMMEQLQTLADARRVNLNFVVAGLDPIADRPRDWAEMRADLRLTRANWFFLSSNEDGVKELAHRLGIKYRRYGDYIVHDLRVTLLSAMAQPLRSVDRFDDDLAVLLP